MKKDDSILIYEHDLMAPEIVFYFYTQYNTIEKGDCGRVIYVDSNDFLHSLDGYAWVEGDLKEYRIHGKELTKEEWEIERNRILILEEI